MLFRSLAAAGEQATNGAARRRLEAWRQLAAYYKGFLGYRKEALAAVQPGDEYQVNNHKIAVVESDDEVFKYRVAGETKRVDPDKIPGGIVLAIVTEWFDDNPANHLYLGAYHLAKPEPDRARAREHLRKAQAGGAEAAALMTLIDDPVIARAEGGE